MPTSPRRMLLTAAPIKLKTDRAVSLGVIVNELVSNACKYAYAPECEGEVPIKLARASATHLRLSVEDDGVGMPKDGSIKGTGLGTKLIRAMASSMQAEISFDPAAAGARATLNAPY